MFELLLHRLPVWFYHQTIILSNSRKLHAVDTVVLNPFERSSFFISLSAVVFLSFSPNQMATDLSRL